jgi:hypothetical protein
MEAITNPDILQAIHNTPGAEILSTGSIRLQVSRYQKPEQGGMTSIRTGVFYFPELKSPYSKSLDKSYGGSQYITGTLVLHHPYIIMAGAGGNGPEKAFTNLYGKVMLEELHKDIFKVLRCRDKYDMEEQTVELLDKWDCDVDMSYDIVRYSYNTLSNRYRYSVQELVFATKIRDKGYDSVLSYSKHKGMFHLSEVFELRQEDYPDDSGFVVENTHIITSYKVYESMLTKDVGE